MSLIARQGISNHAAEVFAERHGSATWRELSARMAADARCPRLGSSWHYAECGYRRSTGTCGTPHHALGYPVTAIPARRGALAKAAEARRSHAGVTGCDKLKTNGLCPPPFSAKGNQAMTDQNETSAIGRRTVLLGAVASAAIPVAARASDATKADYSKIAPEGLPKANQGSILAGKVAVITGAARGIGRAIAWEMAANGADIIALDICGSVSTASNAAPATPTELDETAEGVRKLGRKCKVVQADIRDIASLRRIAGDTESEFGKVDILVANAAIQRWKPLLEMEDSDWNDVIENNLNGTANTVRAFAPGMVKRQYGRIILLSSMQGKQGTAGASSYSASKWGILGLMKSASMELGKHKVTVNALIPGLVDTALTRYPARYRASMAMTESNPPKDPTPQEVWDARLPMVPLRVGWMKPADLGPAAVFLASDGAAMVSGAEYEVDAGDSAHNI